METTIIRVTTSTEIINAVVISAYVEGNITTYIAYCNNCVKEIIKTKDDVNSTCYWEFGKTIVDNVETNKYEIIDATILDELKLKPDSDEFKDDEELHIVENEVNGGYNCVFKYNNEYYYASLYCSNVHGNECVIFPADKDGNVTNWSTVYCELNIPITEESLRECINEYRGYTN